MIVFHRVLIGTAILFCGGVAWWSLTAYGSTGERGSLALGLVFAALGTGLAYYLQNLRRFLGR